MFFKDLRVGQEFRFYYEHADGGYRGVSEVVYEKIEPVIEQKTVANAQQISFLHPGESVRCNVLLDAKVVVVVEG